MPVYVNLPIALALVLLAVAAYTFSGVAQPSEPPDPLVALKAWIEGEGGLVHPALRLKSSDAGGSRGIRTATALPSKWRAQRLLRG